MRKLLTIVSCLFFVFGFVGMVSAVEWHTANSTQIGWDAVTKSADGSVTFDPAQITYQVYMANAATDPNKANATKIGSPISETTTTITLNIEGRFIPGVSAIRTINGSVIGESDIAWADEQPTPWGIQFFVIPPPPTGISPR